MNRFFIALGVCTFLVLRATAQIPSTHYELIRINAASQKGFNYPYYLYIPDSLKNDINRTDITLLVIPNNTGTINDTLAFHDTIARKQLVGLWSKFANRLNTIVLMPVFPRKASDPLVYTHALDRDVFTTKNAELKTLDLQLIAMIKDARVVLNNKNFKINKKIWLNGYSASGMFSNRFAFLHPEIVQAVASGSPGGWPIAPVKVYNSKLLRYPIGINDVKELTHHKYQKKKTSQVSMFIYMGDIDDNDSVNFFDSYDKDDKDLIFSLFGDTPIKRWETIKSIYQQQHLNATFKLYPGIKHTINNEMITDVVSFFKSAKKQ
jgi:dienelactone hydrolase